MFNIWKNMRDLVKVSDKKVYLTNLVFILHSKVTVIILLGLSFLVTCRQYLGDPIDCISSADIKAIADKYCWIHSTFTRATLLTDGRWGYEAMEEFELLQGHRPEGVPGIPGIGLRPDLATGVRPDLVPGIRSDLVPGIRSDLAPGIRSDSDWDTRRSLGRWRGGYEPVEEAEVAPGIRPAIERDRPRMYHSYYQWVWLVLFLQAGVFYLPYWLWKLWDRGRIKLLVADLNLEVITALDDDKMASQKQAILAFLTPNVGHHSGYAGQYIFCEILNTFIVITQIIVTDAFLNWSFSGYGLTLFSLSQRHPYQRSDELSRLFPTVTACRIATGGVAFGTMEYDLLCVLPINVLNEKIYIFLWFWFLGLAALSVANLVYRALLVMMPPLRRLMLRRRLKHHYLPLAKDRQEDMLLECSYSDWFMLSKLGDNLNPVVFAEILEELKDHLPISNPSTLSSVKKKLLRQVEEEQRFRSKRQGNNNGRREDQMEDEAMTPLHLKPPPPPIPIKFLSSAHPPSHRQ